MDKTIIKFPWYGVICGLGYIALLLGISDIREAAFFTPMINELLALNSVKLFLFVIVVCAFALDFLRCKKAGVEYDERLQSREEKIDELFESKYALQNKVHRYSGHADKLKLFLSDKLLEYIEYDEKFLHFKNIASEVRHNGIISYDRVTSILKDLLDTVDDEEERLQYQKALNSMVYLWDLLDLSTTDNIALYVANKLYECEELYYRKVLDDAHKTPFSPVFSIRDAIIKSLEGFVRDQKTYIANINKEGKGRGLYQYEDEQIYVSLEDVGEFFGNENYIVLVMENLINNALYYADQKKYKNQYAKLSLQLTAMNEQAVINIYNPGPSIDDDVKDKIYQLGFSGKRTKAHHGKGLGLYFVKQIVSGYEGSMDFKNIFNHPDTYIIRVECEDGSVINQIVEVVISPNGKPTCLTDDEAINKSFRFSVKEPIKLIEVSPNSTNLTHMYKDLAVSGQAVFLDPEFKSRPSWSLDVRSKLSSSDIIFKPLDTTGVEFTILIPTAVSRMESDYHDNDNKELGSPDEFDEVDKDDY